MSDPTITGGCHCGALRYTVEGKLGFSFACFCTSCQKLSAGARLVGVGVQAPQFSLTGAPSTYTYPGGKDQVELQFCGTCGTHVAALPKAYPGFVSLRTGTLDDPSIIPSLKPIFTDTAMHWELGLDA